MNVPSQTEILLLRLKIPVVLDLIEFEIFTWRLLKIAFPVFLISSFLGEQLLQETPRGSRLWRSQYFPQLRNIRISTNTPSQTPATRLIQMAQYSNKSTRKESSPEDYICIFFPSFAFIRRVRSIAKKNGIVQVQYCAWLSVCHFIVSNTKWSYRGDREMESKPLTL